MTDQWRLKPQGDWHQKPRAERLANVLYPNLVTDADTRASMLRLAAVEGKQSELGKRMQGGKSHDPWWKRS
jgi:hypothetical protein